METTQATRAGTASQWVTIFVFLALLWLPLLESFLHQDKAPQVNEKRALAAFPGWPAGGGTQNLITGLNQYYDDHFGFRERLIYWQQSWKLNWFKDESFPQVVVGANGWLFNSSEDIAANCRATTTFTSERLRQWRALLEARRDWLAKRGIRYIFTIAPCKQSIYPEYLPEWMKPIGPITRVDQFLDYMRANSAVEISDSRRVLLDGKTHAQVYHATDTHWNEYGAFLACEELIRKLSAQMPELKPLPVTDFIITTDNHAGGNLAGQLAAGDSLRETNWLHLRPRPPLEPLSITRAFTSAGIFMQEINPKQKGYAMIFGDSFGEGWFPLIGYHFNRVDLHRLYDNGWRDKHGRFIKMPGHVMDLAAIEHAHPDVVIDEILEDFFWEEDPGATIEEEGLK